MKADAPATPCRKPAPLPPPPALLAVRARSRSRVADLGFGAAFPGGPPDTPPRRSPVTVPFLWEEAPGKPKAPPPPTAAAPAATNAGPVPEGGGGGGDDEQHDDQARPVPVPLKLPPRLQQVASFAAADTPLLPSPKAVLQGPYYYGCAGDGSRRPPPRWFRSGGAFRRTPSAGVGLFSRTWSKPAPAPAPASGKSRHGDDHERDAAGPDAPWCSPASSSSSSSVSTCFGGDEHGRGKPCADGREVSSEEDGGSPPRGSVRITRLRRNRSLPSVTTSNLWVRTPSFLLSSAQLSFPCAQHALFNFWIIYWGKDKRLHQTKKSSRRTRHQCSANPSQAVVGQRNNFQHKHENNI
jgi:hypothetical protein